MIKCPFCPKEYKRGWGLKIHVYRMHRQLIARAYGASIWFSKSRQP